LQNLFEQSSLAIFIIDPQSGVHMNVNQAGAELTGYAKDQLMRMTIFDLCHPQEQHRLMNDMKALMNGARLGDREVSIVRRDSLIRIIAHTSKDLIYRLSITHLHPIAITTFSRCCHTTSRTESKLVGRLLR
jgi:PAS domain S-box-containing protein